MADAQMWTIPRTGIPLYIKKENGRLLTLTPDGWLPPLPVEEALLAKFRADLTKADMPGGM